MKISFIMGIYPSYGGVEKVTTYLANEFVRRGHEVSIVSFAQPYPEAIEQDLNKCIKLVSLKFPVWRRTNMRPLRKFYHKNGLDIMISQWAVPAKVAWFCKRAIAGTNARLITVHHNQPDTNSVIEEIKLNLENNRGNKYLNRLKLWVTREVSRWNLRQVYHASDRFVVLSESFKTISVRYMRLHDVSKLMAIPNPITIDTPLADECLTKENTILYVGRIENNQKRTLRLLDIWERIKTNLPDWNFKIIGNGPDKGLLEQEIARRKLERIEVTGFTNPAPYLAKGKILLLVSEYEGFGLVISEGMSYGVVPVVLGSFSACRDIITDSSIGVIVDYPFNADEFADEVLSLALDRQRLKAMSAAAISSVRRFSITSIADKWESLFVELTTMK